MALVPYVATSEHSRIHKFFRIRMNNFHLEVLNVRKYGGSGSDSVCYLDGKARE